MRIPYIARITAETPIRFQVFRLKEDDSEKFNNGTFARSDYRFMFVVTIDKEWKGEFRYLQTPDFKLALRSIWTLWFAKNGDPFNRHGHPVNLQAFDKTPVAMVEDGEVKQSIALKVKQNGNEETETSVS